jgi:hypothetical protein
MLSALDRQIEQWNRDNLSNPIPRVDRTHRHGLRTTWNCTRRHVATC